MGTLRSKGWQWGMGRGRGGGRPPENQQAHPHSPSAKKPEPEETSGVSEDDGQIAQDGKYFQVKLSADSRCDGPLGQAMAPSCWVKHQPRCCWEDVIHISVNRLWMKQIPLCYVKGKHSPQVHGLAKGSAPSDWKEGPTLKAQHWAWRGALLSLLPWTQALLLHWRHDFHGGTGWPGIRVVSPGEKGGGWQELSTADS